MSGKCVVDFKSLTLFACTNLSFYFMNESKKLNIILYIDICVT